MKALNLVLAVLLAGTQYALWFGDKNFFDLQQLRVSAESAQLENDQLVHRNERMVAEVIDLKDGGETVETIARSELGLIKQGETFYQLLDD